eukprot:m.212969 g.212969  ORF g.212969 m.212969 type:complete len:472 (-) comp26317_c0_seq1:86-1501(-)
MSTHHAAGPMPRMSPSSAAAAAPPHPDGSGGDGMAMHVQNVSTDMSVAVQVPQRFASVRNTCPVCGHMVEPGAEIYPVRKDRLQCNQTAAAADAPDDLATHTVTPRGDGTKVCAPDSSPDKDVYHKTRWLWAHQTCAADLTGGDPERPICPYFYRRGQCAYGDGCFFAHRHHPASHGSGVESTRSRKKRRNVGKVSVFRRWLVDTFGVDGMKRGTGVMDVAGGKGELAFELMNLNGIPTCVIDPRVVMVSEYVDKLRAGLYTRNPLFRRYIDADVCAAAVVTPQQPAHVKLFLMPDTVAWVTGSGKEAAQDSVCDAKTDNASANFFERATQQATGRVLVGETSKVQVYTKGQSKEDMTVRDDPDAGKLNAVIPVSDHRAALHTLRNASMFVGLHTDGAAEPMIDLALQMGKPFACVPCCACSRDFPSRKFRGKAVRSYADLCDYLQSKDERIERATLDMDGRNIVLYFTPS